MDGAPSLDRTTTSLFGIAFFMAAAVRYGNAQISAYGFDIANMLTSTAFSVGQISVSVASIVSVLSILAVYFGSNSDLTEFANHQSTLGMVTAGLVVLTTLSSDVYSLVDGGTHGLVFSAVLFVGFVSMAEMREIHDKLPGGGN